MGIVYLLRKCYLSIQPINNVHCLAPSLRPSYVGTRRRHRPKVNFAPILNTVTRIAGLKNFVLRFLPTYLIISIEIDNNGSLYNIMFNDSLVFPMSNTKYTRYLLPTNDIHNILYPQTEWNDNVDLKKATLTYRSIFSGWQFSWLRPPGAGGVQCRGRPSGELCEGSGRS